MIAIIDYDMGNLKSVEKAFEKLGAKTAVTRDEKSIKNSSHVVLPGVGAFGACMKNLSSYGLIEPILRTIEDGRPFLGVCLGLQLLFEESEEDGPTKGLGVIKGKVVRFPSPSKELKVPHMGWNSIRIKKRSPLLNGIPDGSFFYFVHSYYGRPVDSTVALTETDYGVGFVSSIARGNVFACQFHPEKSQQPGLKILENFMKVG
jgi:glutamine amidotransferase